MWRVTYANVSVKLSSHVTQNGCRLTGGSEARGARPSPAAASAAPRHTTNKNLKLTRKLKHNVSFDTPTDAQRKEQRAVKLP